jgi:cation transport regulator ChaC
MPTAHVFGYGSLLQGGAGTPCRLAGHRRRLGVAMDNRRTVPGYKYYLDAATGGRPAVCVAFWDLVPDPASSVLGIAFAVADGDLEALDARERNYRRVEVSGRLDADLGGPVWAYLGLASSRERYARAARDGRAVVARAYLEGVRSGFAAAGLAFEADPVEIPVIDLTRVDVPGDGDV